VDLAIALQSQRLIMVLLPERFRTSCAFGGCAVKAATLSHKQLQSLALRLALAAKLVYVER